MKQTVDVEYGGQNLHLEYWDVTAGGTNPEYGFQIEDPVKQGRKIAFKSSTESDKYLAAHGKQWTPGGQPALAVPPSVAQQVVAATLASPTPSQSSIVQSPPVQRQSQPATTSQPVQQASYPERTSRPVSSVESASGTSSLSQVVEDVASVVQQPVVATAFEAETISAASGKKQQFDTSALDWVQLREAYGGKIPEIFDIEKTVPREDDHGKAMGYSEVKKVGSAYVLPTGEHFEYMFDDKTLTQYSTKGTPVGEWKDVPFGAWTTMLTVAAPKPVESDAWLKLKSDEQALEKMQEQIDAYQSKFSTGTTWLGTADEYSKYQQDISKIETEKAALDKKTSDYISQGVIKGNEWYGTQSGLDSYNKMVEQYKGLVASTESKWAGKIGEGTTWTGTQTEYDAYKNLVGQYAAVSSEYKDVAKQIDEGDEWTTVDISGKNVFVSLSNKMKLPPGVKSENLVSPVYVYLPEAKSLYRVGIQRELTGGGTPHSYETWTKVSDVLDEGTIQSMVPSEWRLNPQGYIEYLKAGQVAQSEALAPQLEFLRAAKAGELGGLVQIPKDYLTDIGKVFELPKDYTGPTSYGGMYVVGGKLVEESTVEDFLDKRTQELEDAYKKAYGLQHSAVVTTGGTMWLNEKGQYEYISGDKEGKIKPGDIFKVTQLGTPAEDKAIGFQVPAPVAILGTQKSPMPSGGAFVLGATSGDPFKIPEGKSSPYSIFAASAATPLEEAAISQHYPMEGAKPVTTSPNKEWSDLFKGTGVEGAAAVFNPILTPVVGAGLSVRGAYDQYTADLQASAKRSDAIDTSNVSGTPVGWANAENIFKSVPVLREVYSWGDIVGSSIPAIRGGALSSLEGFYESTRPGRTPESIPDAISYTVYGGARLGGQFMGEELRLQSAGIELEEKYKDKWGTGTTFLGTDLGYKKYTDEVKALDYRSAELDKLESEYKKSGILKDNVWYGSEEDYEKFNKQISDYNASTKIFEQKWKHSFGPGEVWTGTPEEYEQYKGDLAWYDEMQAKHTETREYIWGKRGVSSASQLTTAPVYVAGEAAVGLTETVISPLRTPLPFDDTLGIKQVSEFRQGMLDKPGVLIGTVFGLPAGVEYLGRSIAGGTGQQWAASATVGLYMMGSSVYDAPVRAAGMLIPTGTTLSAFKPIGRYTGLIKEQVFIPELPVPEGGGQPLWVGPGTGIIDIFTSGKETATFTRTTSRPTFFKFVAKSGEASGEMATYGTEVVHAYASKPTGIEGPLSEVHGSGKFAQSPWKKVGGLASTIKEVGAHYLFGSRTYILEDVPLVRLPAEMVKTLVERPTSVAEFYPEITKLADVQSANIGKPVAMPAPKMGHYGRGMVEGPMEFEVVLAFGSEAAKRLPSTRFEGFAPRGFSIVKRVSYADQPQTRAPFFIENVRFNVERSRAFREMQLTEAERIYREQFEGAPSFGETAFTGHGPEHGMMVASELRSMSMRGMMEQTGKLSSYTPEQLEAAGKFHDIGKFHAGETEPLPHAEVAAQLLESGRVRPSELEGMTTAQIAEVADAIRQHTRVAPFSLKSPSTIPRAVATRLFWQPSELGRALATADRLALERFGIIPKEALMWAGEFGVQTPATKKRFTIPDWWSEAQVPPARGSGDPFVGTGIKEGGKTTEYAKPEYTASEVCVGPTCVSLKWRKIPDDYVSPWDEIDARNREWQAKTAKAAKTLESGKETSGGKQKGTPGYKVMPEKLSGYAYKPYDAIPRLYEYPAKSKSAYGEKYQEKSSYKYKGEYPYKPEGVKAYGYEKYTPVTPIPEYGKKYGESVYRQVYAAKPYAPDYRASPIDRVVYGDRPQARPPVRPIYKPPEYVPPTRPPYTPPTRPPYTPPTRPPYIPPEYPPSRKPPYTPPTRPPYAPPTRPPYVPPTRPPYMPPLWPPYEPPPARPPRRPPLLALPSTTERKRRGAKGLYGYGETLRLITPQEMLTGTMPKSRSARKMTVKPVVTRLGSRTRTKIIRG